MVADSKPKLFGFYSDADTRRSAAEDSNPYALERDRSYRSPWRRDYARLIHCPSFRRLKGKTQLYPSPESDFFRNRLTHSIEVAQVAKTIASKANASGVFGSYQIDLDLIEFAGLAHDIGHPPFGHNGEEALDQCMRGYGGFEGNAQTLRILGVLEKKVKTGKDAIDPNGVECRSGLNLTYRTLASILKYDNEIPTQNKKFEKGYYSSESGLVRQIKKHILGRTNERIKFKTIECHIMDVADDIAYSTYDLEDSFKAGFLTPLDMLAQLGDVNFREKLVEVTQQAIRKYLGNNQFKLSSVEIYLLLEKVFSGIFPSDTSPNPLSQAAVTARISKLVAENGYVRTEFTSHLVDEFIEGVQFTFNRKRPALSEAHLELGVLKTVETLKRFTFLAMTMSSRLQIANFRGQEIVRTIFDTLLSKEGHRLLPEDVQTTFLALAGQKAAQRRVVCDFIAGMTDRYAIEFYERIKSANGLTMFKPL